MKKLTLILAIFVMVIATMASCSKKEGCEAGNHKFGDPTTDREATCYGNMTTKQVCGSCGEVKTTELKGTMRPHSWGEYKVTSVGNCYIEGQKVARCTNEGCTAANTVSAGITKAHANGEWIDLNNGFIEYTCAEPGCGYKWQVVNNKYFFDTEPYLDGVFITGVRYARGHLSARDYLNMEIPAELSVGMGQDGNEVKTTVYGVKAEAFKDCIQIESVTVKAKDVIIEDRAFEGCKDLRRFYVDNGVSYFGKDVFKDSARVEFEQYKLANYIGTTPNAEDSSKQNLYVVLYSDTADTTFNIHENTQVIAGGAFAGNTNITSAEFLRGITFIGDSAFEGCINLENVSFSATVKTIGASAFKGCSKIRNVAFTESIKIIGDYAFEGCKKIQRVSFTDAIEAIGASAFKGCEKLEAASFAKSVGTVGDSAFEGCSELREVRFGADVNSFGARAFANCAKLESFIAEGAVTASLADTFSGSSNVKVAKVPMVVFESIYAAGINKLTNLTLTTGSAIADGCFAGKTALAEVILPDTVVTIGAGAFSGCTALTNVRVSSSLTDVADTAFEGCTGLISTDNVCYVGNDTDKHLIIARVGADYQGIFTAPADTRFIMKEAFKDCAGMTAVKFGESLVKIGSGAFVGCGSLAKVVLPGTFTDSALGDNAFNGCSITDATLHVSVLSEISTVTLTNLTINGGDAIAAEQFKEHTNLEEVDLGGVVTIGDSAFLGCTSLTTVKNLGNVNDLGAYAFNSCSKLKSATLGNGITVIKENTFEGCVALSEVALGGVTAIDAYAFYGCLDLNDIDLAKILSVGESAFVNCAIVEADLGKVAQFGENAFFGCSNLAELKLNLSVSTLSSTVFYGCGIETAYIHSGVASALPRTLVEVHIEVGTALADQAFWGCTALEKVYIKDTVKTFGTDVFKDCSSLAYVSANTAVIANLQEQKECLKEIVITSGITVPTEAFCEFEVLQTVRITSAEIAAIETEAFKSCGALKTLEIVGNKNLVIADSAFKDCFETVYTDAPASITLCADTIGDRAFSGCDELVSVNITYVKTIGTKAFYDCVALKTISVSSDVESIGDDAFVNTALEYNEYENGCYLGNSGNKHLVLVKVNAQSDTSFAVNANTKLILDNAFDGATAITTLTVPNSVMFVGTDAFRDVTGVKTLTTNVFFLNGNFIALGNNVLEKLTVTSGGEVTRSFVGFTKLTELSLPTTALSIIGDIRTVVTEVTVNGGLKIAANAFSNCTALTKVTVGGGVEEIGTTAFFNCTALMNIYLDSVKRIGNFAFAECAALETVTLPVGVESIGDGAFYNCVKLADVTGLPSADKLGTDVFYNCIYNGN